MPTAEAILCHYSTFLNNPAIQSITDTPKWCISDNTKRPINMYSLFYENRIRGAKPTEQSSTVTLPDLIQQFAAKFPDANAPSNFAFNLDVLTDNILVLDIEPSCPSSLKRKFLELPYLYGETSMSGKGIHLVFPKPANFNDFPQAINKMVIKGEHGYYELLMNHWITFTGKPLGKPIRNNTDDQSAFERLYAMLAAQQKTKTLRHEETLNTDALTQDATEIPHSDFIVSTLLRPANKVTIDADRYDKDKSRCEFAYFQRKYSQLKSLLHNQTVKDHQYTAEEIISLLYAIGSSELEHRDKHDTERQGVPWLMYLAARVVTLRRKEET